MRITLLQTALAASLLLCCVPAATAAQATLVGTVTDRTTGKPDVGDTVALIAFGNGMQVAAQTKTDAAGRYTLPVADAGVHLVRVDHEKATYFQPAPQGAHTVDVDVYDVAANVPGIVTEADVLSLQTEASGELSVTEDFFVRNDSKPPRTQFSEHAYDFFLPPGARLGGAAAMGPAGMPISSTPVPMPGEGHYAFVFPLRPGESRFQLAYTLPYGGSSRQFSQRESTPTENLVVLLPKSMRFSPAGTDWQPVPANPDAQTFVRKDVAAQKPVGFSIAGSGALPRELQNAGGNTPGTGQAAPADQRPGGGLGPPIDTPDPLHRYKGWLLGGLGLLLVGAAAWLMRAKPGASQGAPPVHPALQPTPAEAPPRPAAAEWTSPDRGLRPALEQALLALEREHALGRVPDEEYDASRAGLKGALERALHREAARWPAPTGPE